MRTTDGAASNVLESLIRGPGAALPAVLLLAPATDPAWARAAAIELARAWVRTGRRIVLADLDLADPSLHVPLRVPNEEGLVDHFEFGTSLERLALPVDDGGWSLLPAGPYTPDPEAVLTAPEWPDLIRSFAGSYATLLLHVPADAPGLPVLAEHVGAVIDLGGGETEGVRPYRVLASFRADAVDAPEPAEAEPEPVAAEPEPEPEPPAPELPEHHERLTQAEFERIRLPKDARSREALMADLRQRQREALMHPPADALRVSLPKPEPAARPGEIAGALSPEAAAPIPEATPLPPEPPLPEPPLRPRVLVAVPAKRPDPRRRLWALLVVLLLSALYGGWHFFGSGWLETRRARAEADAAMDAPARTPAPIPPLPAEDTVLSWAVAIEAHQRLPDADERVRALRAELPQAGFFIAPLVREGALFYHVMAGPVRDSARAAVLMDTLIAKRAKTGGTATDIRNAGLAFLLGDFGSADSAAARVAQAAQFDIPAYVLALAGPPPRWRVYAGGYVGPAEAEVMRELLRTAGQPDSLVPRVGRVAR